MKKILAYIIVMIMVLSICSCSTQNNLTDKQTQNQTKTTEITAPLTTREYIDSEETQIMLNEFKTSKLGVYGEKIVFVENFVRSLLDYNENTDKKMTIYEQGADFECVKQEGRFDSIDKLYSEAQKYCSIDALKALVLKEHYKIIDNAIYTDGSGDTEGYPYFYADDMSIFSQDDKEITICVVRRMEGHGYENDLTRKIVYTFEKTKDNNLKLTFIGEPGKNKIKYSLTYGY